MHSTRLTALVALATLVGCRPSETVFKSDFNNTPIGSPPVAAQAVGTANWVGDPGSVTVAGPPSGFSGNWLSVGRSSNQSAVAGMIGTFSAMRAPGKYHFACVMDVPSGSGLCSIAFASPQTNDSGAPLYFLHIDFGTPPQGSSDVVRIDDNPTTDFGSFTRDKPFDVFVTIDTSASPPTAHVGLAGAGSSGSADYTLPPSSVNLAQQFDKVEVWMGYPWIGNFLSTDISVRRDLP